MARHPDPESVSNKVAQLQLNETIVLTNPYTSVMVMVSNLKRKEGNQDKVFKIKSIDATTSVTRVR
jgi:CRISPR/Cas system-associated endonuclease Cas3-HD